MKNSSVFVFFFATSCILTFVGCSNEIADIRAITDASNKPVQSSYNAEYIFSEKGKIINKLMAVQLDQYQGDQEYIEASGGFTMLFYDSLEREDARITAMNGRFTQKEKNLKAWNNVRLINSKGERLETSELIFEQDSSRISTEKDVTIITANGSIIHGRGLVSNDSFTKYKIIQPTGDLYIDEKTDSTHAESK